MQAENNKSFHTISAKHVRLSIFTNGPRCLICFPGLGLNGESFVKALPGDFSWILIDYMDYETTEINDNISSDNRATILSVDSFFRSLMKIILLPILGYISEISTIYISILILALLVFLNQIFFRIPDEKKGNKNIFPI